MLNDTLPVTTSNQTRSAQRNAEHGWRLGRLNLELRQHMPPWHQALILGGALVIGLGLSAALLVAAGVKPSALFEEFILENFSDPENLHSILFQAAPLILVGVGAAMAFRVRFWNLGIEGQMIWGGIAATAVSFYGIGPPALRLFLMMLFAAAAGAAWIFVPLWLRMRWRVNEIIVTLLLNYVALNFLLHLLYGPWLDPKDNFPHSPQFQAFERLPELGLGISGALVLALLFTALSGWLVLSTRFGFYMKFVHNNDRMALAVGVPIGMVTLISALLSGALSGLAGFVIAAAQEGRLTQSYFEGYGFSGILIAFLARSNPIAAMVVAILVAVLFVSGRSLQVFYQIPFAMVQLIQAIIVISVAASEFLMRHRLHWVR
jgi:general nucleoside transport system permease protein